MDGGAHQRQYGLSSYIPGFARTYGGIGAETGDAVVATSDGGYAIAGNIALFQAALLVKTDSNGNLQWNQTYNKIPTLYSGSTIVQPSADGFVIVGTRSGLGIEADAFLWKIDVESGLAWTDSTADSITLYRGATDAWWNYIRVRIWTTD